MTTRINVTVSDSVHLELKQMSSDFGVPISSICSMSIMTYLQQQKAISAMGDLKTMMAQLTTLQEGEKSEMVKK